MARGSGSMVVTPLSQVQRCSNRANRGLNGRDVQLAQLGEQLVAPTRVAKRSFVPEEGIELEINARAPVPKKRRTRQARANQPSPEIRSSSPRQPSPPAVEDNRFGFSPPQPIEQPATPIVSPATTPISRPVPTPTSCPISRPVPTPISRQAPTQISSTIQLAPPALSPTLPSLVSDVHNTSESKSEDEAPVMQPEIDEQSDDEDDRQAHALLCAVPTSLVPAAVPEPPAVIQAIDPSFAVPAAVPEPPAAIQAINPSFAEFGTDQSVLQSHYHHNSPPKAPTFVQPTATPPARPLPIPHPTRKKRPRSGKTPPWTLESYPPMWQEVIIYAKCAFRAYVAGQCGFPDPVSGLQEAKECLEDALEVHKEGEGTVEPGYVIDRDMAMLVFTESWQLRSRLKTDIRVQVRNLKALFPDDTSDNFEGQQTAIRNTISDWIADGSYLHDTVPNLNAQIHFTHPIIASTCKSFYFDKWSEISTFDRDTFHGSVPKPLVALIGTIYRNVLDEWSGGMRNTTKLESEHYGPIYYSILSSLDTVNQDFYHSNPLHKRLSSWAGYGRSMSNPTASTHTPTTIRLNLDPPAN